MATATPKDLSAIIELFKTIEAQQQGTCDQT